MPVQLPSWTIRRRVVAATLLWCGGTVTYMAQWGRDIELSEAVVNGCLLLMASVIGSYVFGAVWDDKNVMQSRPPRPPEEPKKKTPSEPAPPEGFAE